MSNKTIEAVLRLSAKLGPMGAFNTVNGKLNQVARTGRAMNATMMALGKGYTAMASGILRFAGPVAAGLGGVAAAKAFAATERRMERIGITADASSEQTVAALDRMRGIAQDLGTPIENVVEGLESLVASGKSVKEALAILPAVAGTAHAADAAFGDMATTADAISGALKITAGEMQEAFDIIAAGGKAGKFELKDMAAELPSLAPAFAALGYHGKEGLKKLTAALQTVRLETGTSGEAATSFMDVLTKMESLTVFNNFKRFGIDIRREMKLARASGEDVLDAFIRLAREAVKGDMSKLPQLFTDKQMLIGMRAMMNNTDKAAEYMRELGRATGTVRRDIDRLADDAQGAFTKIGNSFQNLKESIGKGFVQAGGADFLTDLANNIDFATAVNAGLERKKVAHGFLERSVWGVLNDQKAKDSMAWVGGYRSEEQRRAIDAYQEYAAIRRAAGSDGSGYLDGAFLPTTPRDRGGLPVRGPILPGMPAAEQPAASVPVPATRPSDFEREFEQQQAARPYQPGRPPRYPAGATHRDAERDSMKTLRSNPNEVADAIDEALSAGSERAAAKIKESGEGLAENAAQRLKGDAAAIGNSIGEAAAAAFNRNAKAPRGGGTAGNGVSGDVGHSGPVYEGVP